MGLGGRFFIRNTIAVGVAFGVALLLLVAVNSISPWIFGNTGSLLAVQRAWSEIRYLVETEGGEELLRPATQMALTAACQDANCEWLLLKILDDVEPQLIYRSYSVEGNEIAAIRRAAAANDLIRHGWRSLRVQSKAVLFADNTPGELLFLSPPMELLGMERGLFIIALILFALTFTVVSLWLSRWLQSSITDPLIQLKEAAQELTLGEDLPEIASEGEGEVAELAVALDQLRLRLKESVRLRKKADEERAFLISSISHDLKTPLTAITGYLEAVQLPELPEERRRYYLQNAELKAQQLRYLIDDLLLYSRLESQQTFLALQPTDADEFFTQAVLEHLPLYEQKHAELSLINSLEGPVSVNLDRERFPRVLQNILDNSRRFIPAEGGRVVVEMRANRSDFIIELSDNGPGLAPGEHEKVFERFYRSDASRSGQGSGLGLAIARQIVNMHGGRIWAREPNEGENGCIILISLPLTATPPNDPS